MLHGATQRSSPAEKHSTNTVSGNHMRAESSVNLSFPPSQQQTQRLGDRLRVRQGMGRMLICGLLIQMEKVEELPMLTLALFHIHAENMASIAIAAQKKEISGLMEYLAMKFMVK